MRGLDGVEVATVGFLEGAFFAARPGWRMTAACNIIDIVFEGILALMTVMMRASRRERLKGVQIVADTMATEH